jgi:hypothetical protein
VKRLDQHLPGRPSQRHHSLEQLVDQLVRQLADEVALPVVAIHAVAGVEHVLLGEERLGPHGVVGEPPRGAQRTELGGICFRPGVTGCDGEGRRQRSVQFEHCLAAEVTRCAGGEVPKPAKRIADSRPGVGEATAEDPA